MELTKKNMASNGLVLTALKGTCRMCRRVRKTDKLKKVGEVRHGFATGYIWECTDEAQCDIAAQEKLNSRDITGVTKARIENAAKRGRFKIYRYEI